MGLNLSVEGGNREQGTQETDSSPQQQERKSKHLTDTDLSVGSVRLRLSDKVVLYFNS